LGLKGFVVVVVAAAAAAAILNGITVTVYYSVLPPSAVHRGVQYIDP